MFELKLRLRTKVKLRLKLWLIEWGLALAHLGLTQLMHKFLIFCVMCSTPGLRTVIFWGPIIMWIFVKIFLSASLIPVVSLPFHSLTWSPTISIFLTKWKLKLWHGGGDFSGCCWRPNDPPLPKKPFFNSNGRADTVKRQTHKIHTQMYSPPSKIVKTPARNHSPTHNQTAQCFVLWKICEMDKKTAKNTPHTTPANPHLSAAA